MDNGEKRLKKTRVQERGRETLLRKESSVGEKGKNQHGKSLIERQEGERKGGTKRRQKKKKESGGWKKKIGKVSRTEQGTGRTKSGVGGRRKWNDKEAKKKRKKNYKKTGLECKIGVVLREKLGGIETTPRKKKVKTTNAEGDRGGGGERALWGKVRSSL